MHSFEIHLLSMVDACTAWSKFCRIQTASSLATSSGFDRNWLCRYPRPQKVVHDNGNEFMGCEFQELLDSYGIEAKPMTVKNPSVNAIVERIHGTLGEQLRATVFGADWSDDVDTLIQACAYALRATSPARGTYSPAQLGFGHDLMLVFIFLLYQFIDSIESLRPTPPPTPLPRRVCAGLGLTLKTAPLEVAEAHHGGVVCGLWLCAKMRKIILFLRRTSTEG